jgi:hypothetical protein
MKTRYACALCIALSLSQLASAGPYTDDLAKRLVSSTTPADIDSSNAEIGDMFMRLLTDSCRDKARNALKYEGLAAIQLSLQLLGQVAGAELASNPEVQSRMAGMAKHIDEKKIKEMQSEPDAAH